ncbi:protein LONGIFOLIA 1 [Senna tora]|uniref:Protein LONGIFOLIA 1 n=1 Tax=Senna tora TaxID=362788 RepID=A0A834SW91_9FABA|nr:protein LONGIFOLIA 1 [Senna tora]
MGCMAGFLQIFDRHQLLTGKRVYSAKRLPPSLPPNSSPEPHNFIASPAKSRELDTPPHPPRSTPSPDRVKHSPSREPLSPAPESQPTMPLPLPVFEFKQGTRSSWKFSREAPRLSLDSRAVVDAKGTLHPRDIRSSSTMLSPNPCENPADAADSDTEKQRRSTSVIARLMGLESLPDSPPEPVKNAELRRSASESRVSRDLFQQRYFDSNNVQRKQLQQQSNFQANISSNVARDHAGAMDNRVSNIRPADPKEFAVRNGKTEPAKALPRGIGQKKSFFDSADFFPEPKQTVSIYGEIEKRLKMRGIDEPSKDLETLKHILEALQLKGLLHSKKSTSPTNQRNFVFDGSILASDSPIVVMKPARSPATSWNRPGRAGGDSPPSSFRMSPRARGNLNLPNETLPTVSPRRDRPEVNRTIRNQTRVRNSSLQTRSESSVKSPNRIRVTNTEDQRKGNGHIGQRRVSPVHSPKAGSRRNVSHQQVTNRSPRMRKPEGEIYDKEKVLGVAEDESSTISESSISTSSQTDTERCKLEVYKEGRNLLERCDKLVHCIEEITASELQPSPVSVLDPSFDKDECSSPSPVMKRCIDYRDQPAESEDDMWSANMCSMGGATSEQDYDFVYVSEILRASNYLPEEANIFLLLEKQQYLKGKDTSKASTLQRRLIFDTIHEILNRNRQLPPWKAVSWIGQTPLLERIWSDFRRIRREREKSEDLFEVICGVLRKDLAEDGMNGWGDCPVEMGEVVLDIERLVFKDLIGETIRDLAAFAGKSNKISALRRKLMF